MQSALIVDNINIMVTRMDKSSKTRFGAEYMLLWRVAKDLGQGTVDRAINGDIKALARIENYAYQGRKKPAVVRWVTKQTKKLISASAKVVSR